MPAKRTAAITHDGKTLTAAEWAKITGVPAGTIMSRLGRLGWTPAEALTTPPDARFKPGKARALPAVKPPPPVKRHADGRAYARWQAGGARRCVYFGEYGGEAAAAAYARFAAEWAASGGRPADAKDRPLCVAEVIDRYLDHAEKYYVKHGKPTSDLHIQKTALAALNELYGDTPAAGMTPANLRALKAVWVRAGRARTTVNAYARRIKLAFQWAASHSLVPAAVYDALKLVESEVKGRTAAKETRRKKSVPVGVVEKTLPHLHKNPARQRVLASLVLAQLYGGMRPGEACGMRPADLDTTDPTAWCYDVGKASKTLHLDKERVVWLGPMAQAVIRPHLAGCPRNAPVFRLPARRKGVRYVRVSVASYERYVKAACEAAGVPAWTPHQLRKTWSTLVRDHFRSEAAGAAGIGDTMETARRHYMDPTTEAARRAALELG